MTKLGLRLPKMSLFVRLTAIVALGIVALFILKFVLGVVLFAALVAAIVVGILAAWNFIRRRRSGGAITITARR
jgi:ABC-type iron transport system FetAB permease component